MSVGTGRFESKGREARSAEELEIHALRRVELPSPHESVLREVRVRIEVSPERSRES